MDSINSGVRLTKKCVYDINLYTRKEFRCTAAQRCCGSECCDDDVLETTLIWVGLGLCLLVACILCIAIIIRLKKKKEVNADKHHLPANMVTAALTEVKVHGQSLDPDLNKPKVTKAGGRITILPFTHTLLLPPSTKLEAKTSVQLDQQPLLAKQR